MTNHLFLLYCTWDTLVMSESDWEQDDCVVPKQYQWHASVTIGFEIFIFALILPIFCFDLCNKKRNRSRAAKSTKRLMYAVCLSNAVHQLTWILLNTTCLHCFTQSIAVVNSRTILRGINLLFLIHRAKLVQGMTPILSKKWFNTILPTIVVIWHVAFFIAVIISSLQRDTCCVSYVDTETFHWCWDLDAETSNEMKAGVYVLMALDLIMTIFLMILFIFPLYRVYQTDLGILNDNQVRQRMKLQRLLIWSVILTFVNQITSTFFWLLYFSRSPWFILLGIIGKFDPPINVWSSWLMVTRNREYLQRVCCCCCHKTDRRRRVSRISSALTDVSSRNSKGPLHITGESTIELPVLVYRN